MASGRILITGARGYIASALRSSLGNGDLVLHSRAGFDADGADVVVGDLTSPVVADRAMAGVDTVFHLAGQTSAYFAESHVEEDRVANVEVMRSLLSAATRAGKRPAFIFAATSTQCGMPDHIPVNEAQKDLPITVYDRHKLEAETLLCEASHDGVVNGVSLRLATVYGPGPASSSVERGVVNTMVRRALAGQALTIYGSGEYLRDFVFVQDVAEAFMTAAENAHALAGRYFLIGTGSGLTVAAAIRRIASLVNERTSDMVDVVHVDEPNGFLEIERRSFVADCAAFESTGWQAEASFDDGVRRTVEHFSA